MSYTIKHEHLPQIKYNLITESLRGCSLVVKNIACVQTARLLKKNPPAKWKHREEQSLPTDCVNFYIVIQQNLRNLDCNDWDFQISSIPTLEQSDTKTMEQSNLHGKYLLLLIWGIWFCLQNNIPASAMTRRNTYVCTDRANADRHSLLQNGKETRWEARVTPQDGLSMYDDKTPFWTSMPHCIVTSISI